MTHVWNLSGLGQTAYDAWREWMQQHPEHLPHANPGYLPPAWEHLSEGERAAWCHVGMAVKDAVCAAILA